MREREDEKKGGRGGGRERERAVVLCSHLIKDHFSRHRLSGVVCVSARVFVSARSLKERCSVSSTGGNK